MGHLDFWTLHAKFQTDGLETVKIEAIQNRYQIVVYHVISDRESKNPRTLNRFER